MRCAFVRIGACLSAATVTCGQWTLIRDVLDLKPSPNDVSTLAPGVYFVRVGQDKAIRKVLVTK